jgi:uncharacterized membrane protein
MTDIDPEQLLNEPVHKAPLLASLVSLIGIADSTYLTIKHYAEEPVPCSLLEGCEKVLTSPYSEFAGAPIAAAGAVAYFVAFSLSMLAAFGHKGAWSLFGGLSFGMGAFSVWLLYLQAFVIGAFCQFCIISAASSILLALIFAASKFTFLKSSGNETDRST